MQEAVHGTLLHCSCTRPAYSRVSSSSSAGPATVGVTRAIQKVGQSVHSEGKTLLWGNEMQTRHNFIKLTTLWTLLVHCGHF